MHPFYQRMAQQIASTRKSFSVDDSGYCMSSPDTSLSHTVQNTYKLHQKLREDIYLLGVMEQIMYFEKNLQAQLNPLTQQSEAVQVLGLK